MQLDKTQIVIRQRSGLDILDISLQVIGRYCRPLAATFCLGVAPLALANHLLISWMADVEYTDEYSWRFLYYMSILVYLEAPLASIFCTAYIGRAVFQQRCRPRDIISDVFGMAGQLCWGFIVLRGIGLAWLLVWSVERIDDPNYLVAVFLGFMVFLVFFPRTLRPYAGEVIVLERNPMFSGKTGVLTFTARSRMLHTPNAGELFGRGLGAIALSLLLFGAITFTFIFVSGVLFGVWTQGPIMVQVCTPLAMWAVALYFCVVRYLSYLDRRIRQEGWEVELLVRAEANRLHARGVA